jgi:hypothetical protein
VQAVIDYEGAFITAGPAIDSAGLMDLIAAAAWWIEWNKHSADVDEAIEPIFDVTRWWPRSMNLRQIGPVKVTGPRMVLMPS